ncbi:MAG TPA: hypothetical protein VNS55_07410 [Nocardioides sp.]|nr:hypothetical protein [Nocardioides sp.]
MPHLRPTLLSVLAVVALGGALTACGGPDEMKLGEEADISFYPTDGGTTAEGKGTVTITDVREGSADEMKAGGFDLDPDQESAAIYYVDVTFANTGDSEVTLRSPDGEDSDENLISALAVIDLGGPAYEPCPGVPEKLAAGESVDGCAIVLVPAGSDLARISYFPGGTDDFLYWETGL